MKFIVITLFGLLFEGLTFLSFAQNEDKKVIISAKEAIYTYEMNKTGTVQVNAGYTVNYKCLKPSTVSFAEFYDNYSEIKKVKIKGIKGVTPQYGMYKQENIFFSDAKACYFDIPFIQSGSEATVTLNKVFKDISRFIFLPLVEPYYTNSQTIKIVVPDWIKVDILFQNLSKNITKHTIRDEAKKTTTHFIQIVNQPEFVTEENSPYYMHSYPYLLIVPRESSGKTGNIRYFKTADDLYQWSKQPLTLMNTNRDIVREKALDLIANCRNDDEKIRELCKWVQQSIRYIAYEDGISAFKPDDAQEVMAKKYGDCKGMSNLLKSLLVSVGFDARLVWAATKDIGRGLDIKNPIPFANHIICALNMNDSLYYFDPTVKSLSFGEIPEYLQGQTALIEDGKKYIISQIPQYSGHYNSDSLFIQYKIAGDKLTGKANRSFKGESKNYFSYWMDNMTETEKNQITKELLKNRNVQDSVFNITTEGLKAFLPEISLKYEIYRKSNMNIFGNQIYVNLDEVKDYQNDKIDIAKRKTAFKQPFKDYTVRISKLSIPDGYNVAQLPQGLNIVRDKYSFVISYSKEKDEIIYQKKMSIFDPILEKNDFEQWNSDIDTLRKTYNELIVLERNNNK